VLPPSRIMNLRVSRRGLIPVLLFIAAFIATSFQCPTVRLGSGFETLAIARNLAGHGQFANPFSPRLPDAGDSPWYAHSVAFVIISAVMGLLLLAPRRDPILVFFACPLFIYTLLYYLVQPDPRFRTPILWISLLAGGYLSDLSRRAAPVTAKVLGRWLAAALALSESRWLAVLMRSRAETRPDIPFPVAEPHKT
jgi:hypothetical protein